MWVRRWAGRGITHIVIVALMIAVGVEAVALTPLLRSRVALSAYKDEFCRTLGGMVSADIVMVGDSLTIMGDPWERHLRRWPCRVAVFGHTGYSIAQR